MEVEGANLTLPVNRLLVTTAKSFWSAAEASAAAGHLRGATVEKDDKEAYTFDLLTRCTSIHLNFQKLVATISSIIHLQSKGMGAASLICPVQHIYRRYTRTVFCT